MTDLHCHILPGADDGAASEEESLAMFLLQYYDNAPYIPKEILLGDAPRQCAGRV